MKYEVIEERRIVEGGEEIWYLVEPRNWLMKVILSNLPPFSIEYYSPHSDKNDAIKESKLKSKGMWDKTISRKSLQAEGEKRK